MAAELSSLSSSCSREMFRTSHPMSWGDLPLTAVGYEAGVHPQKSDSSSTESPGVSIQACLSRQLLVMPLEKRHQYPSENLCFT